MPGTTGAELLLGGSGVTVSIASEELAGARVSAVLLWQSAVAAALDGGFAVLNTGRRDVSCCYCVNRLRHCILVGRSGAGGAVLSTRLTAHWASWMIRRGSVLIRVLPGLEGVGHP